VTHTNPYDYTFTFIIQINYEMSLFEILFGTLLLEKKVLASITLISSRSKVGKPRENIQERPPQVCPS
jgi:hypothetical protein